jgi:hypothetical protein
VADIVRTGALQEIALPLWASHRSSPRLRDCVLDLLCALTELTSIPLRLQTKNNLLRTIADGWDELRDSEQASEWLRKIPNPQFRGKALGDFVSRRLTDSNLEGATEAHTLVKTYGGRHPGWGMVRLGVFHLRHEQWDDAADAFASAVQSGATQVGNLNSQTAVLLAELALAFDLLDQPELAQQHLLAAVRRARHTPGSYNWWSLLNVAERTYWVRSSDLGAIALEEATLGALQAKDDPQRIPLLCFLARVQHIVARQPERAQQALQAAMDIIRRHVPDQVKRTTLRCEIAEALHLCGLDEQAREELSHIAHFAQQRASHPYNGDEIVAEAALGHARVVEIEGAKRLLNLVRDRRFDSVARAWAIIHTYEGDDDASEAEVCKVANENRRARIRRDLATILVRLGRVRQALVVTRRIQADRDNAFPRVAMTMVENGFRDAFFELIIPATRFPNATGLILGCLLRLHPEIASNVSSSLVQYVPDILTESSST